MALDIFSSNSNINNNNNNEFMNFIIYDTISAVSTCNNHDDDLCFLHTSNINDSFKLPHHQILSNDDEEIKEDEWKKKKKKKKGNLVVAHEGGRKKRRRKARAKKNKEEEETQRMTHIAVERNRRKQMNQHLSLLRSLMPSSYLQRGDQASIVGGAIEFVKELEQLLQSLEAQKLQLQQQGIMSNNNNNEDSNNNNKLPFSEFFMYPQIQYTTTTTSSQIPNNNNNYSSKSKTTIGEIEVTLIETHANLKILTRRRTPSHLSKLVSAFHSLFLTILHINVTTMDPLVLYSISAKVEEQCQLTCVDDIAGAVHHMLRIIEEGTGPVLA